MGLSDGQTTIDGILVGVVGSVDGEVGHGQRASREAEEEGKKNGRICVTLIGASGLLTLRTAVKSFMGRG